MPQRYFFVVVVLIFQSFGEILGQQKNVENFSSTLKNQSVLLTYNRLEFLSKNYSFFPEKSCKINVNNLVNLRLTIAQPSMLFKAYYPLSPAFYSDCLGWVCKKELQLERATTIPLRFRLGSLQYTNYLEGKSNSSIDRARF